MDTLTQPVSGEFQAEMLQLTQSLKRLHENKPQQWLQLVTQFQTATREALRDNHVGRPITNIDKQPRWKSRKRLHRTDGKL